MDDNGTLGTKDQMRGSLKCFKKILKMGHFKSYEHKKVRHFEKKHVTSFQTENTEIEYLLFWGMPGHLEQKSKCNHMTKSFKYFLNHNFEGIFIFHISS